MFWLRRKLILLRMWITNKCYKCGELLEHALVYSNQYPYITCGWCGVIFDKNRFGEVETYDL